MRIVANRFSLVWAMTVLAVCVLAFNQDARGGEFRFVVEDLPNGTAAWLPSQVVIHQETDLRGGLILILKNPTVRTHVFFVERLDEQIVGEHGGVTARPLRVTIAPEETVRVVLNTEQFQEGGTKT